MELLNLKKGEKIKLSKDFYSTEFDCNCKFELCQTTVISTELLEKIQIERDLFAKTLKINSGYRCKDWNRVVGGAKSSQHLLGKAADIVVYGMTPKQVADQCQDFKGVGRYKTFTHVDVRSGSRSRWGKN